jgi:hypothetical protein
MERMGLAGMTLDELGQALQTGFAAGALR